MKTLVKEKPCEKEDQLDWEEAGKPNGQQTPGNSTSGVPKQDSRGKKKKRATIIIIVVALLLIVGISRIASCGSSSKSYDSWPTSGLAAQLPKPDSSKIKVQTNSDDRFYASVDDFSKDAYSNYVESCKEKGFTVDASTDTSRYEAYNSEGYHLELSCYSTSMNITVEPPLKTETITWPTSGPASLLPKPASDKGSVSVNSSSQFTAKISNTSKDAYEAYTADVSSAGFNVDFSKSDTVYQASNADGAKVYIKYEGNNQMSISAYAAKDSSSSSSTLKSDSSSSKSSSGDSSSSKSSDSSSVGSKIKDAVSNATSSAVSADFKEMMDGYESIMNKYCDFMVKYNESSDTAAMLDDLNAITAEELEWSDKVNAVDQSSLSTADQAYYLEVTNRVNKRLLEISQ